MGSKRPSFWAQSLGHGLALVQHGVDRLIEGAFTVIERSGSKTVENPPKKTIVGRAIRLGKGTLSFLGGAGRAYYEKYEELKRQRGR